MNDIIAMLVSLTLLAIMVGIFALGAYMAMYTIPFFVALGGYVIWKNNPNRLEKVARNRTWNLYHEAKRRSVEPLNIEQEFDKGVELVRNEANENVYQKIKAMYINLWRYEGYYQDLQKPPVACNSIAGGKYRDYLNKLEDNRPALTTAVIMANLTLQNQSFNEDLAGKLVKLFITENDGRIFFPKTVAQMNINFQNNDDVLTIFDNTPLEEIKNHKQAINVLPHNLRTEHHHICSGTGGGKTQALQQMILADLQEDASIVVIDSQGEMINKLAERIDRDRLILIDPEHCPPSLDLFATQKGEQQINTAIELYEYIFSALDAEMTSKQRTLYRFVSRLLLHIPKANIHTMRELLEPKGLYKYQKYVDELGETAKSFFKNEFDTTQYKDTKQEVLRRLYSVLENRSLEHMLSATEAKLDIAEAVNRGKVILINTSKSYLKQGAKLFGRIFIAQVMQAVMARGKERKRTYLYIDEFQDYAEESHVFLDLFEKARKFNLGMVVAHQYLGQLPPKLMQSIDADTSIKFARGVSANDARVLAKQMHTTPEFILEQNKGDFACYLKGVGTTYYHVEFGKLERLPRINDIEDIHIRMNELYNYSPTPPPPETEQGSGEVIEDAIVIEEKPKKRRKRRTKAEMMRDAEKAKEGGELDAD